MDDTELVISYLFEMWTTEQGAELTREDVEVLMEYLAATNTIKLTETNQPPIP